MLINEEKTVGAAVSALGFSYVDEYNEDYEDSGKEDDFEEIDDSSLDKFDDDIYEDDFDDIDQASASDVYDDEFEDERFDDFSDSEELD